MDPLSIVGVGVSLLQAVTEIPRNYESLKDRWRRSEKAAQVKYLRSRAEDYGINSDLETAKRTLEALQGLRCFYCCSPRNRFSRGASSHEYG
jgi:hypothetical protein